MDWYLISLMRFRSGGLLGLPAELAIRYRPAKKQLAAKGMLLLPQRHGRMNTRRQPARVERTDRREPVN